MNDDGENKEADARGADANLPVGNAAWKEVVSGVGEMR